MAATTMMATMMMTMVPVDIAFLPGSVFECDYAAQAGESQTAAVRAPEKEIGPSGRNRTGQNDVIYQ
jgi:hypothetical protein